MSSEFRLQPQEPPYNHASSCNLFQPGRDKPFLATAAVIDRYGYETLLACLQVLRNAAELHGGIDYLQVFENEDGERIWFIEDGPGGAITAMLPDDY